MASLSAYYNARSNQSNVHISLNNQPDINQFGRRENNRVIPYTTRVDTRPSNASSIGRVPSVADVAFQVLIDGCKAFEQFRRRRDRNIEKVAWCIFEWSLWVLIPLSITATIQYCTKSASIVYLLLFAPILVSMISMEFRAVRYNNHSIMLILKYAEIALFTFFFVYHVICFTKICSDIDLVFFFVFTTHFVFYMISLIHVYLVGVLYKVLLYRYNLSNTDFV